MLSRSRVPGSFFFFQAEDGIRDYKVTGVQTCALPIFGAVNGALNLDVALQALERTGRGRRLSTPRVSTQNNRSEERRGGTGSGSRRARWPESRERQTVREREVGREVGRRAGEEQRGES